MITCLTMSFEIYVHVLSSLLGISYTDHFRNKEVRNTIRRAIGSYEDLFITVRKRKLR